MKGLDLHIQSYRLSITQDNRISKKSPFKSSIDREAEARVLEPDQCFNKHFKVKKYGPKCIPKDSLDNTASSVLFVCLFVVYFLVLFCFLGESCEVRGHK